MVKSQKQKKITPLSSVIGPADALSMLNAAAGMTAILLAIIGEFAFATLMLLLALIFDTLDGRLARMTRGGTQFGAELDSLADIISFGVAPAAFASLLAPSRLMVIAAVLLVVSGAVRLARFSILGIKTYFIGTPIPMNAMLIIAMFWLNAPAYLYAPLILLMAILMNAPIKVPKPK